MTRPLIHRMEIGEAMEAASGTAPMQAVVLIA